jgi:deoxyribonucleoside regulator
MPKTRAPARERVAKATTTRDQLLVAVSEMYYVQGLTQDEISSQVGVTRSMISRLLKEARHRGIVEIRVHRQEQRDSRLEAALHAQFSIEAFVAAAAEQSGAPEQVRRLIGRVAAGVLVERITSTTVLGLGWGTSVSAVVDEVQVAHPCPARVVQLVGALGARDLDYDGHNAVQRLAERLGGEGFFLHAPFLVDSHRTAQQLLENQSVRETVELFKRCKVVLTGIGSTDPRFSGYYHAGYVPISELERLRAAGAVGDVCGHHLDKRGHEVARSFDGRLVTISRTDFLAIPKRIGVAGGPGKADPVLAALRAGYINVLVTDSGTAARILSG